LAPFDLFDRPDFDVYNLPFTAEIRDRVEFFESHSIIVWIRRNGLYTNVVHVVEAFMVRFGLDQSNIQVSRLNPADFLMPILDRDIFEEVFGRQLHSWRTTVPSSPMVVEGPSYSNCDEVLRPAVP
jgi:hypothetical protein